MRQVLHLPARRPPDLLSSWTPCSSTCPTRCLSKFEWRLLAAPAVAVAAGQAAPTPPKLRQLQVDQLDFFRRDCPVQKAATYSGEPLSSICRQQSNSPTVAAGVGEACLLKPRVDAHRG